jgi:hypothetical protein
MRTTPRVESPRHGCPRPSARDHGVRDHSVRDHSVRDHGVRDHGVRDRGNVLPAARSWNREIALPPVNHSRAACARASAGVLWTLGNLTRGRRPRSSTGREKNHAKGGLSEPENLDRRH